MKAGVLWIYRILAVLMPESRCYWMKNALLRFAGAKIGKNVRIYSSVCITGVGGLEIGDDVHIGTRVVISTAAPGIVRIGSHVDIGPCALIFSGTHEIDIHGEHIAGNGCAKSVKIGDGCWIGAGAEVLPGVELPQSTLVAAGSVVTKSVSESHSLIAGVPAVVKKSYKR